ncbi:hypothetical protein FLK61_32655 [Paenalkalicoccus suaedae]|uniref:Flagellar hook-length control protein FliK n=1 Tax=Paenalkalicoccus suaedae TaxID=2592382 RepID=A0A859FFR2_9BACI|nr:hypothetical protein [Paenalkalicoccus suaedae]QKS71454.1 hypothetical protein FLK61_32655 [Paenalkalicoccus suaedae]
MDVNKLQSLLKGIDTRPASLSLRPGQVFHGAITKLFPQNIASLSVGTTQLTAQLEAQLQAGNRYFFRVLEGEGIPRLQVLQGSQTSASQSPQAVLQAMGLPVNARGEALLTHLSQANVPFSRSDMAQALTWLSQSSQPMQQALQTISQTMERQLPVTTNTLQAMAALNQPQATAESMNRLLTLLLSQPQTSVTEALTGQLARALQTQPQTNASLTAHGLIDVISRGGPMAEQALALARQLGITNATTPNQFNEQAQQALLRGENQVVRQLPHVVISQEQTPNQTLQAVLREPQGVQTLLQLLAPNRPMMQSVEQAVKGTAQPELQQAIQAASSSLNTAPLKAFMQLMGLNHENMLGQAESQQLKNDNVKALLMQLLQQPQLPTAIKREAEFLLARITGTQLLSTDSQGPLSHTIVQLPIAFQEKFSDVTVQWQGKLKSDGVLDEDHCRILFYLELEALKDTVIDVQIQNRVIGITIFNEFDRPASVSSWFPLLKESLQEMNYTLSSINWRKPVTELPSKEASNPYRAGSGFSYKGVDIRI